jgi:hypothetical protein
MDTVRVLRIIEYVGPRDRVEDVVARSIHGEKRYGQPKDNEVVIHAATIGSYPDILVAEVLQERADQSVPATPGYPETDTPDDGVR